MNDNIFKASTVPAPDGMRVLRNVMPTTFEEPSGVACPDFEKLADAVGFTPGVIDPGDALDRVVLGIALACNDIRDALWVLTQMSKGKPAEQRLGPYEGARLGMSAWAARVLAGITNEVLVALNENAKILKTHPDVVEAVGKMTPKNSAQWHELLALAGQPLSEPRRRFFHEIRNNLSYHYHQPKRLASGYREAFIDSEKTPFNRLAYTSAGRDIETIRFYFADAAVQAATHSAMQRSFDPSSNELTKVAAMAVNALFNFVLQFLELRLTRAGAVPPA